MKLLITLTLTLVFGVSIPAQAGEIYKWTDKNGVVHYGEQPHGKESQKLSIPKSSPNPATQDKLNKQREELLNDGNKPEEKPASPEDNPEQAKKNCELARKNLKVLQENYTIIMKDKDGKEVYLDDEKKAKQIEENQQAIKDWCK